MLNCIAGYQSCQGAIRLGDIALDTLPVRKRPCRYLNQRLWLFPWLTVLNNLRRGKEQVCALLNKMGVVHLAARYPHQISGGEQ